MCVEEGQIALSIACRTEYHHTGHGHVRVEENLGHEHRRRADETIAAVLRTQVLQPSELVGVLLGVGLTKQAHAGEVEDERTRHVQHHLTIWVLAAQRPHRPATNLESPAFLSIAENLVPVHFRECIRELVRRRLIPDKVRSGRFLPGSVFTVIPDTVVRRSHADENAEQFMAVHYFLIAAVDQKEIRFPRADKPHGAATKVAEIVVHELLHLLHDISRENRKLTIGERNGNEIIHNSS